MKKLFTICLFAIGFLFTTQSVNAQQKFDASVNEAAQNKAVEFGRYLKADQATQEAIYKAYQEYFDKENTLKNSLKPGTSNFTTVKTKINQRLLAQLNSALTSEQYTKYLELTDQSGHDE